MHETMDTSRIERCDLRWNYLCVLMDFDSIIDAISMGLYLNFDYSITSRKDLINKQQGW